jgi:predicted metal-dependent peptidase
MAVQVKVENKQRSIAIYYNPQNVLQRPLWEVEFILCHEVYHVEAKHHLRRNDRDFDLWQQACDYETNGVLVASGKRMPADGLFDKQFDGMDVDQIFSILYGRKQKPGDDDEQTDDSNGEQQDENEPESQSTDDEQNTKEKTDDSDTQSNTSSDFEEQKTQESAVTDDNADDSQDQSEQSEESDSQKQGKSSKSGFGEVRDFEGETGDPTEDEKAAEEQSIEIGAHQAAQLARKAGNMPAYLEQLVDYLTAPKLDWRTALASWINEVSQCDYSWSRVSRRYASMNIPMPALYRRDIGKIAIAIDTSGSVMCRPEMISEIISEVQSLFETFKIPSAIILPTDTRVMEEHVQEIGMYDEIDLTKIPGGGGTDFRPPFEWIEERSENIIGMIYLTDGECWSFPSEEPEYRTLWFVAKGGMHGFKPPFGEVVDFA